MKSYTLVSGLLLLAVTACSDSVPAGSVPVGEQLSPDLSVSLPQLRQLVELTPAIHQTDGHDGPRYTPEGQAYAFGNSGEIPQEYLDAMSRGLITRTDLDVGFMDDVNMAYAQFIALSRGSSYRNHLVLKVKMGGTQIGTNEDVEAESCLCAHLLYPWGKTTSVTVPVEGNCGHLAEATGTLSTTLGLMLASMNFVQLSADTRTDLAHNRQQECGGGGSNQPGGGGNPDDELWYICYWEDVFDYNGDFIRRQDLGCQELNAD